MSEHPSVIDKAREANKCTRDLFLAIYGLLPNNLLFKLVVVFYKARRFGDGNVGTIDSTMIVRHSKKNLKPIITFCMSALINQQSICQRHY